MRPLKFTVDRPFDRLVAGVTAALLGVAVLAVLPAAMPAQAGQSTSSAGVLALRNGDIAASPELWASTADSVGYVVLNAWEHTRIAALKAARPDLKVLVYKDVSATVAYATTVDANGVRRDNALLPAGVGYEWARTNAPSWFLRDAAGKPLEWADYRGVWPMDVGDPGYQKVWLDNVVTEVRRNGWDGVMLDDTLTYLSHPTVGGAKSTQIPDDAAMLRATGSFLSTVGSGLKAAGYLAVPNVTLTWQNYRQVLTSWSPSVSGWLLEYFVKWGLTSSYPSMGGADWASRMDIVETAQSLGTFVLAVTYGGAGDSTLATYQRGSWLLAWDGRAGASMYVPSEGSASHLIPAALTDVGAPVSARRALGGGSVWRRDFTGGVVLVNTGNAPTTVALGGSFTDMAGRSVSSVTLAPTSAAILRGTPGTTHDAQPAPLPLPLPLAPPATSVGSDAPVVGTTTSSRSAAKVRLGDPVKFRRSKKIGRVVWTKVA